MSEIEPIGERMARVETKLDHAMEIFQDTSTKVDAMHDMFQQAKGARYFIVGAAAFMGFLGAKFSSVLAFVLGK